MSSDTEAAEGSEPMLLDEAEKLDKRIQRMADTAAGNLDTLADLLAKAKAGEIHETLGFESWTAYVAERLKPITKALDREELRALVVQLYEAGMSCRAIAEATGQSKSTVQRQVSQSGTAEHVDETTGLDGKGYSRGDTNQVNETDAGSELVVEDTEPEQPTDQQDSERHHNGGRRTKWEAKDYATRAKSYIGNIEGDAELHTRIYELIDELVASIQPATESN